MGLHARRGADVRTKDACKAQGEAKVYAFRDMVSVGGEEAIAQEIGRSGPVVCGISATA
jgi:hypothetical protein